MDFIQQLEYPLPILKILAEKIVVETSKNERNSLAVDNIGGGLLSGRVMSNSPALKFDEQEFSGNQVNLDYTVSIDGCKAGDVVQSEVVIMSNGGERSIPVLIKVIPACIITSEDVKLTSLEDFLVYAKKQPVHARRLFVSPEFMMWLTNMGYEYMDIFEHLVKDPNKERALENFFILSRLKKRAVMSVDKETLNLSVDPEQKTPVTGLITVYKSGWGYVEADIEVLSGGDWLSVSPERLKAAMFADDDTAEVEYSIDPARLKNKMNKAVVRISDDIEVALVVKKKSHIDISTDRGSYDFDDAGVLRVSNNCGEDIMLEIGVSEGFVKFDGRRYFMGSNAEIPFMVKLSALQMAQVSIKRQPFLENVITVTTRIGSKTIKRSTRIMVGNRR